MNKNRSRRKSSASGWHTGIYEYVGVRPQIEINNYLS